MWDRGQNSTHSQDHQVPIVAVLEEELVLVGREEVEEKETQNLQEEEDAHRHLGGGREEHGRLDSNQFQV